MGSHDTNNLAESQELTTEPQDGEDGIAYKLSKELSNWRRRRGGGNGRLKDDNGIKPQLSEPARTIKVRGHETLVIRKSKLNMKPKADPAPSRD